MFPFYLGHPVYSNIDCFVVTNFNNSLSLLLGLNKDYDFTCETCKIFMIVVKDTLENPSNEQAIADALRQVCSVIFPDGMYMYKFPIF